MDKFTIEIELGNAAMQHGWDVATALREVADKIAQSRFTCADDGKIRDLNGNTVGKWEVK